MSQNSHFKKLERQAKIGEWLAIRASKRQKNLLDKLASFVIGKATEPAAGHKDFMRDALLDSEIEFDPQELEDYQSGK